MLNGPKPFIEKTIFLLTAQKCHLWNSSSACIYVSLPWPTGPFDKFLFWSIGPFDQVCCCSVSQSCQTLCDLMNCRLLCPSPSPGGCTNSCPLSQWCHPTISSSVVSFSFCPQSFPGSGSFLMSQLLASGGQSTGASASASVLPMNIQSWFPLGLTGLISLQTKELSRVFTNTKIWKHHFFSVQPSLWANSHIPTWPLEKPSLWLHTPLLANWLGYML